MTWIPKILAALLLIILAPSYAQNRALLIGIDEYQHVGVLRGSKQDVEDMRQFIQTVWHYEPHQIRTLTDAQATRQGILSAFEDWLIKGSRPGDNVLFHFSGHGYYLPDLNGDESDGYDEAICPVETRSPSAMIKDDEIEALLRRLNGRQVTIIIDACHSGTVTRSLARRPFNPTIKVPVFSTPPSPKRLTRGFTKGLVQEGFIATSQKNIIAYSAVAPNQQALVDIEKPYRGVFTRRFIEAIQEKRADSNFDGKVSHAEVLEYTRRESQAYCDRQPQQCKLKKLTPQLEIKPDMLAVDARTGIVPRMENTVEQATSILTHDNEAHLQIKLLPQNRFHIGDAMQIQVNSNHHGYLLLFDINSAGKLTRLFPNQYSKQHGKQGYVRARQSLTIPEPYYGFEFTAEEPLGKGLLIALLVEDKISTIQTWLPTAFEQVKAREAQAVLQQLRYQLNQTLPQYDAANRPVQWSLAITNYQIVR